MCFFSRWFICFLALCLSAAPIRAAEIAELERVFATCTGRLTAQLQDESLWDTPQTDQLRKSHAAMEELLLAVANPENGRARLTLRVEARLAHARLLRAARFSKDPRQAQWAQRRAAHLINDCVSMLMS
ncbi:hypothetical protein BFP70_08040 [Thioclava sp. SK-1]|uniref:hypothetical protein n=1 Tax=Thioclava sp. SK-1 TaxID=1889770 RepID=UPI0008244562|nr:hypothetical protein [Thioclava sp. SK-1]OCX66055.1 hypothetical protein BFP70_08040 [Thioclava sp. SK-1]